MNDISVDCEIAGVSDESDNEGHEECDQELDDRENCEFEVCDSDNRELHNVQNKIFFTIRVGAQGYTVSHTPQ